MLRLEIAGNRSIGRTKEKIMDIGEDMRRLGLNDDTERIRWRLFQDDKTKIEP